MTRSLTIAYGAASYAAFLAAIGYAVGFTGNIVVPRSVMAPPVFKRRWTRLAPEPVERNTYVLASSLLLFLVYGQWRTMPAIIWDVTWPAGRTALQALFWFGCGPVRNLRAISLSHPTRFVDYPPPPRQDTSTARRPTISQQPTSVNVGSR